MWLPNEETEALLLEKVGPRSYSVATPNGTLQRNRSQIRAMPHQDDRPQTDTSTQVTPNDNGTVIGGSEINLSEANNVTPRNSAESNERVVKTSSGRVSRPPKRYGEEL